jgi:hypothetical protein
VATQKILTKDTKVIEMAWDGKLEGLKKSISNKMPGEFMEDGIYKTSLSSTMVIKQYKDVPKVSVSILNEKMELSTKQDVRYTPGEIVEMLNIPGGFPEHNMTGEDVAKAILTTRAFVGIVTGREDKENKYLTPTEALSLVLSARSMGVDPRYFHVWEQKGAIKTQLDYRVSIAWIKYLLGRQSIIYTTECKEVHKDHEHEKVYKAYAVSEKDVPQMRKDIATYLALLREEKNNDKSIKRLLEEAKELSIMAHSTAEGIGVINAEEVYEAEWGNYKGKPYMIKDEKGAIMLKKAKDNKTLVKKRGYRPSGRGGNFKPEKRALVDLANKLGMIDFRTVKENPYKFDIEATQRLIDNPEINVLPEGNPHKKNLISGSSDDIVNGTFEERVDALRGAEEEGID